MTNQATQTDHSKSQDGHQSRPLMGRLHIGARLASRVLPAMAFCSMSAMAQTPGVKFRGDLPPPTQPPQANPGAPFDVELADPKPVLPGSKIIDPKRAPSQPGTPNVGPSPNTQLLPDPSPVTKGEDPLNNSEEPPAMPERRSRSVPAPAMPRRDVPQIPGIDLFPTPEEQMEKAVVELEKGWKLVLHGGLRATWDSNIFIQDRDEQSDFIVTFAPGIAVGIGDFRQELATPGAYRDRLDRSDAELGQRYFFLDYNPSYHYFTDHSDESSFEQDVRVEGRYAFAKLTLSASARFETLNIADTDIGDRVKMRRFQGRIGADYAITDRTTIEAGFEQYIRDYSGDRNDITEYRASGWIDYQAMPKTNIALGYTHGWVDVDNGSSQAFDQVQLRVVWKATEKLGARMSGGVEWRGIDNRDDSTNATFAVGLIYKPFDATSIFLNGFRKTTTSASGFNEPYTSTGFDARVVQRFSEKYFVTAAGGFQSADYDENLIGGFSRKDDYQWGRLSLGWDVNKWLTTMLAYEYRNNDSNLSNRSFEDHLVYLQFSFLF